MNTPLRLAGSVVAVAALCIFASPASAQPGARASSLAFFPRDVQVGTPGRVGFGARLLGVREGPSSALLEEISQRGEVLRTFEMNDEGLLGDARAGDGMFSVELAAGASAPGTRTFRARLRYGGTDYLSDKGVVFSTQFPVVPTPSIVAERRVLAENDGVRVLSHAIVVALREGAHPSAIGEVATASGFPVALSLPSIGMHELRVPNGSSLDAIDAAIALVRVLPQVEGVWRYEEEEVRRRRSSRTTRANARQILMPRPFSAKMEARSPIPCSSSSNRGSAL